MMCASTHRTTTIRSSHVSATTLAVSVTELTAQQVGYTKWGVNAG